MGWISLMFFLMGMMGSCYGLFSLHVVAMEVFPTTSRNSLTNLATTVGRLGGVLAPQTPLLVRKHTRLTYACSPGEESRISELLLDQCDPVKFL